MSARGLDLSRLRTIVLGGLTLLSAACTDSPPQPSPPSGAPVLQCPANVTVADVTTPTQTVVYPKPTLTGGATPTVSSCSPEAGFAFPLGTTAVTCTTRDALDRVATCSFNVTLSPPAPPSRLGVTRVLAFGDSVTEGGDGFPFLGFEFGLVNPATAYPTQLKMLLDGEFPSENIVVINAGRGGEWAGCDSNNVCGSTRLRDQVAVHRPDVLLLLDGYNDLLNTNHASTPLDVTAINSVTGAMRDMVRAGKSGGVRFVFLGTMTPGRPSSPNAPRDRQINPQAILINNQGLTTVAPAEGAHLVDHHSAFLGREQTLVNADGLHLTAEGNRALAETFFARMKQVILPSNGGRPAIRR